MIKLRELRGEKTQSFIADKVGLRRETYRGYEMEIRQADYETLIKLADYFDVSLDYLLGRDFGKKKEASATTPRLSTEEDSLLSTFKRLNTAQKTVLLEVANQLSQSAQFDEELNKHSV